MSTGKPEAATVHVVDDDAGARESLAALLASAGLHVCTHASASALLDANVTAPCTCLIVDVRMPGMNGIELLKYLRDRGQPVPVIIITGHADVAMAVHAMKAGACDFIEKPFRADAIISAVRSALARAGAPPQPAAIPATLALVDTLTAREREVLVLLAQGCTNKAVARALAISPRTAETHRARIMVKLKARSLSQLVRIALETHLLDD
ncbi:MAG: response regulator [Gammaproteobacteria bacterium]|nr:response regulator [Gammaproteobacteria bacterium]